MNTTDNNGYMSNNQMKRKIEKAVGDKIDWWIRYDGNGWYEGGIDCGAYGLDMWAFFYSRAEAYRELLDRMDTKIGESK